MLFGGNDSLAWLGKDENDYITIDIRTGMNDFKLSQDQAEKVPFIGGSLENGLEFSCLGNKLLGSKFSIQDFSTRTSYRPNFLILGKRAESGEDLKFKEVEFEIPGILKFTNMTAFLTDKLGYISNNTRTTGLICKNENFTMDYEVKGAFVAGMENRLLEEDLELDQTSLVRLRAEEDKDFGYFYKLYEEFLKLISYSTGKSFSARKIKAYDSEGREFLVLNNKEKFVPAEKFKDTDTKGWIVLKEFTYNGSLNKYFERFADFERVLDPYILSLRFLGSKPALAFLNACLAVEIYFGLFKESLEPLSLAEKIDCLIDLGDGESFNTKEIGNKDFGEFIEKNKAYYTSFIGKDEWVLAEDELDTYTKILLGIADYYFLEELGFQNKHTKQNILIKRWGTVTED